MLEGDGLADRPLEQRHRLPCLACLRIGRAERLGDLQEHRWEVLRLADVMPTLEGPDGGEKISPPEMERPRPEEGEDNAVRMAQALRDAKPLVRDAQATGKQALLRGAQAGSGRLRGGEGSPKRSRSSPPSSRRNEASTDAITFSKSDGPRK